MIQGTGSNVGKSVIVAGLCRAFARRGLSVRPFKPQNMSNNAAVTADGGEIGRAQALQALACGRDPTCDMNPVLLKPETDRGAQVIVQGQRLAYQDARHFGALRDRLLPKVVESFERLSKGADLVLVEGAGSPAEVNLRARDIANMGFARAAGVPVLLLGDIDRGGVIAQIVGTKAVLDPADAALIRGFAINKFRGDPALFEDGYRFIASRTQWRGAGVIPWFTEASALPAEDAVDMAPGGGRDGLHIVCPMLSRIANFDDLDPLKSEPQVRLSMVPPGRALPGDADVVILPGTKSTRGDLALLRQQGWDIDITAHRRRGGHVLGICGGYQMLGRIVRDPDGVDGMAGESAGLGFLDVETWMAGQKHVRQVSGTHCGTTVPINGYEIHMGVTNGPDCDRPFAMIGSRADGAVSSCGLTSGTYVHGAFASDEFRAAWLQTFGRQASGVSYDARVDQTLDALALHLELHMDLDSVLSMAGQV
ncbi:cobyric acid synthase [Qingshengfaniella alkalisoli]|uniref:Cobyric acid synthase n=1 Tax=Qingshengfaniella alkalisoli TaxID=2599296 RepID=A0A5B8IXC0_9RHOB|nr:cobyric acid synthase [Qingshengfaniella alkalisoli]QDY70283.1 cobyric acid synthase [Qingshengfaniella alkalisoli]